MDHLGERLRLSIVGRTHARQSKAFFASDTRCAAMVIVVDTPRLWPAVVMGLQGERGEICPVDGPPNMRLLGTATLPRIRAWLTVRDLSARPQPLVGTERQRDARLPAFR